ncbi:MAG: sel1 repeat family protein [Oscillospiraceae bacterium]|nr:sel1 repeat family protein [Oscillospiraceae bacterium]
MAERDPKKTMEQFDEVTDNESFLNIMVDMYWDDVEDITRLAQQGNVKAQSRLGDMYSKGYGVEPNGAQAFYWYTKAAEGGNHIAQNNLGVMYSDGIVVEKDLHKAVQLYKKAAESGDAVPLYNLAQYYFTGRVVGVDYKESRRLLRLSAQQGYKPAIDFARKHEYEVGELYRFNYSDVFQWYKAAAAKGDEEARTEYHKMLRNGMGTLEERIAQIGEPPYDKDAENSLASIINRSKKYSREKCENMAYTLYKKMLSSPDIETYEKMLFTGGLNKYNVYEPVKDMYIKAVKENGYIGMISASDVARVEQALAVPDPKPDITHNKGFVIGAIVLLPAILPALFVKNIAALGMVFGLLPIISILLIRHAQKPYGPLVQVHAEKKAAVDNFVKKYGYYINTMYNKTNYNQPQPQQIVKHNNSINYVATYYSRCKILLDRYQAMEFITPTTKVKISRKQKDPKSRI